MITLENIDQEQCIPWIERSYANEIIKKSLEEYRNDDGTLAYREVRYFLKDDIILHIHSDIFVDILFNDQRHKTKASKTAMDLARFVKTND